MKKKTVSVIVPSYNSKQTIARCLSALREQIESDNIEIIVVDSSIDGTAQMIAREFPDVQLYKFEHRKYPGDARNFAISKASGEILAFTDADCIPARNWIVEIIKAHEDDYPSYGGAVENGNPESYIAMAAYFCEFSQWLPQSQAREMEEIPTCCLSIKRWAFDKYGPFLEGFYCSDSAFHWKLGAHGFMPRFRPTMKIAHLNIDRFWKFLRKQFMHGRHFGRVRVAEKHFSFLRRALYCALSPLLPFLLFYRICLRVRHNSSYLKQFLPASPLVLLGLTFWSLGELTGYLLGKP